MIIIICYSIGNNSNVNKTSNDDRNNDTNNNDDNEDKSNNSNIWQGAKTSLHDLGS
jgi:hypothetical protein